MALVGMEKIEMVLVGMKEVGRVLVEMVLVEIVWN